MISSRTTRGDTSKHRTSHCGLCPARAQVTCTNCPLGPHLAWPPTTICANCLCGATEGRHAGADSIPGTTARSVGISGWRDQGRTMRRESGHDDNCSLAHCRSTCGDGDRRVGTTSDSARHSAHRGRITRRPRRGEHLQPLTTPVCGVRATCTVTQRSQSLEDLAHCTPSTTHAPP